MKKVFNKFVGFLESMNLDNFNELTLNFTLRDVGENGDSNYPYGNVEATAPWSNIVIIKSM